MSDAEDKRELLKLKQGIIEQSEIIAEDAPIEINMELHGKARWDNFWYHNKIIVLIVAFFVIVGTILIYDFVTKEHADFRVLTVADSAESVAVLFGKQYDLADALEQFAADYNSDGKIIAENFYIDINQAEGVGGTGADPNVFIANQTKFVGEMQSGTAQIVIAPMSVMEIIVMNDDATELFENLREMFPNYGGEIVDGMYLRVKRTALAAAASWESSCPEDMYLVLRKTGGTPADHERALQIVTNIIDNNKQSISPD